MSKTGEHLIEILELIHTVQEQPWTRYKPVSDSDRDLFSVFGGPL